MKTERASTCICLLLTLLTGSIASAADAIITSSFGSGESVGQGGIIDLDGRFVTIGYYRDNGDDFGMTRHTSDGFLDTSLNGTGMVTTDIANDDRASTVEIQPDGKIILGGMSVKSAGVNTGSLALVRYYEDGSIDTSFGASGVAKKDFGRGTFSSIEDIVLQSDGKIVVVGNSNASSMDRVVVARYTTSGDLDSSFGGGQGYVFTDLGPQSDYGWGIAMQGTKILVTGEASISGGFADVGLIRYNSDGSLDTSFGSGGIVKTDLGASDPDKGRAILVQPDGKILVGAYTNYNNGYANFALVRYEADGFLDLTFGSSFGYTVTDVGINDLARGMALQSDGSIVVAGLSYSNPYGTGIEGSFSAVRYDSWGDLDLTFGMGGIRAIWIGDGSDSDQAFSVDIQSDGTIVLFGFSSYGSVGNREFAILKLSGIDGSLAGDDILTPMVHTWTQPKQAFYDLGLGEVTSYLTVRVKDEYGDAISGLDSSAFVTKYDENSVPTTYVEVSPGIYEGQVDLTGSIEGTHTIETLVTDSRLLVGGYLFHLMVLAPPVPAVNVSLVTDKSTYNTAQGETTAILTVDVTDESNDPITGLGTTAFATLLDGDNATVAFEEILPGIYAGDLDLTGLEDGTHATNVTVTDSRDVSGSDDASFDTASTSSSALHVASIGYLLDGRNLFFVIEIQDAQGQAAESASVSIDVLLDSSYYADFSGLTGSDGTVSFLKRNAKDGSYNVNVTDVSKSGYAWDFMSDALDPGYTKP